MSVQSADAPSRGSHQGAHLPVLPQAVLQGWCGRLDGTYVDCTFGRGGHSQSLLERLDSHARLYAMDRDPQALEDARAAAQKDSRVTVMDGNFAELLPTMAAASCAGILFDLGVSSPQLDQAERGFSFQKDGPLDMRMDPRSGVSAADWLAGATEVEIADALYHYGDENASRRIAKQIVAQRAEAPLLRTLELADLVASVIPRRGRTHPATKTFQALRIVVNDELGALESGLASAMELLEQGGRLAVISFHSLEDRAVKRFMNRKAKAPPADRRRPQLGEDFIPELRLLGKYDADAEELKLNPRSRSARLRVAERLR